MPKVQVTMVAVSDDGSYEVFAPAVLALDTFEASTAKDEFLCCTDDSGTFFGLGIGDGGDDYIPLGVDYLDPNEFMVVDGASIDRIKAYYKDHPDLVESDPDDYDEEYDPEDNATNDRDDDDTVNL